jgi:hypothetical protein
MGMCSLRRGLGGEQWWDVAVQADLDNSRPMYS